MSRTIDADDELQESGQAILLEQNPGPTIFYFTLSDRVVVEPDEQDMFTDQEVAAFRAELWRRI